MQSMSQNGECWLGSGVVPGLAESASAPQKLLLRRQSAPVTASDQLIGTTVIDTKEIRNLEASQDSESSDIVELLARTKPSKVECLCLEDMVYWSQMKHQYPDAVEGLANFQDEEKFAPVSHEFVRSLANKAEDFLGIRRWSCHEEGLECGQGKQSTVWLHIECAAAGTDPDDERARCMRRNIFKILGPTFGGNLVPGSALTGRDRRSLDLERSPPLNWDNSSMMQIALLDEGGERVVGAAVLYINGPACGYLPFFAVAKGHRGNGSGSRFARALLSVLRRVGVNTLIAEACVDPATRDQKVVSFWENRVGLSRCTDEYFDNHEVLTNTTRTNRVCGSTMREHMSGMFAFPDGVFMYRGTAWGWKVGDTQAMYVSQAMLPTIDVRDSVSPFTHGLKCEIDSFQIPSTAEDCGIRSCLGPGELDSLSGEGSLGSVSGLSGQLHTVVSVCGVKSTIEANGRCTRDTDDFDGCGGTSWQKADESAKLPPAISATPSSYYHTSSSASQASQCHESTNSELNSIATVAAPTVPNASSVGKLEDGLVLVEGNFQQYKQKAEHLTKVHLSTIDQAIQLDVLLCQDQLNHAEEKGLRSHSHGLQRQ